MKFKDTPKKTNLSFLKLKDGESAIGVFKGDPYEFYEIYQQGVVPAGTKGASFRFRINFITREGASYVAKVFQNGVTVYKTLKYLNEEYDGLENVVVKISRTGSTKDDTIYHVLPLPPKQQPTEDGWTLINEVELQDLSEGEKKSIKEPDFDQTPMPNEHDEIPF